jgi:hypothetical protein
LEKGGSRGDLKNNLSRGFMALSDPTLADELRVLLEGTAAAVQTTAKRRKRKRSNEVDEEESDVDDDEDSLL